MSNVSYDLDTSGGLMPLIRALIKPPDEEASTNKPKKPQHPYYKRPGKGHNHDSCDACSEGGDLICCDRCPASFHLGCYDPPLEESDIPAGLWLCKECRGSDAEQPSSSRSSRAQSPSDKTDTDKKAKSLRKKTKEQAKESEGEGEKGKEAEKELNPMEALVKAAKIMNPKQFELPREMKVPCIFPGTEKEGSKTGNCTVYTSDAGCVPARTCHVCAAGCKQAPLLQCDYCPLLFHQDCLDPPLTALPTGRWMCPNHVEQYIDWKMVNSVSMSERVALWDKFTGPVDQHAIKVDFIRRARGNRPFRVKVPVGVRSRVVVPEMVRAHYRRPPPLLPSRREFVRCAKLLKRLKASGVYDESDEEDGVERPTHKICMNMSCPEYTGEGPCPAAQPEDDEPAKASASASASAKPTATAKASASTTAKPAMTAKASAYRMDVDKAEDTEDTGDNTESATDTTDQESDSSSELSDSEEEMTRDNTTDENPMPKVRLRKTKAIDRLVAIAEDQLKDLDYNTVKILAYQMMEQIAANEAKVGRFRHSTVGSWCARAAAAIGRTERSALRKLGVRLLPLPSALLPAAERRRIARAVWGGNSPPAEPATPPPTQAECLADRLVHAAVCPVLLADELEGEAESGEGAVATLGPPVPMRAATFRVGTLPSGDLVLPTFCRRVSRTHALIFLDQVTGHYELINYSEWGSVVNGMLYACDTTPHAPPPAAAPPSEQGGPRRILRVNRPTSDRCRCPARAQDTTGAWEGGALLGHGTLLQFGCLRYVLSILEEPPETAAAATESQPAR